MFGTDHTWAVPILTVMVEGNIFMKPSCHKSQCKQGGGPIIGCIKFEGTSTGNNVFVPTKHGSFLKLWIHQFPAWVSSMAKNKSWPTKNVIKHGNGKSTIYI